MLKLTVPETELFDDRTNEFLMVKETTLQLEHSLVSLSKWETKWQIPFMGKDPKTDEQLIDYIRCMTITQNVDPLVFKVLTADNIRQVDKYVNDPMTATTFHNHTNGQGNKEIFTSELIYYYMVAFNIPFECQKWHLSRLLTLIRICSIKNQPEKKMSKGEIMSRNRALNAARRQQLHTKG